MNAVVGELEQRGWRISRASEAELEGGGPPPANLYLNMCQGAIASERLTTLERTGAVMINTPTSVLACHRHHLVRALADAGIPFPRTLIVPTRPSPDVTHTLSEFVAPHRGVWIKRGDVHAVGPEDVVLTRTDQVLAVLGQFAERGIERVAVQEHVRGPVLKFYGVADSGFFKFYDARWGPTGPAPVVDEARLRGVASDAAQRLGLKVFGGDVALPAPDQPVLIDLNDWPSFAPYRAEAASAIASFAHSHAYPGVAA